MAEIKGWFTMNGMHIPIMEGQSKSEAAQKYINSKHGKIVAKLSSKTTKKEYKDYYEGEKAIGSFHSDNPDIDYENVVNTRDKKDAVRQYTAGDYDNINNYLKGNGDFTEGQKTTFNDTIKQMDSCFTGKTQNDFYTYRGIAIDKNNINVGDIITNKGYTSTSISKFIADDFSEYYKGTTIQIKVNKGTKALFIGPHSSSSFNEEELLFARGASIRITGKDSSGVYGEIYYEK